jgi:hypothetical protein
MGSGTRSERRGIRMAERRMFAKTIVLSDAFLDMPMGARCLYFTLRMFADDDGFVNSPKSIMRQIGASEDDLKVLVAKKFILPFESGIIVIKHWRINNYLRNDRYNATKYIEEKSELVVEENGSYTKRDSFGIPNSGIPSIGKDSIDKDSIVDIIEAPKKEVRHKYGAYNNVLLSDTDLEKLKTEFRDYEERIERLSEYIASTGKSYKNHLATIRSWAKKDKQTKSYGRTAEEKNAGYCFNANEDSLDDLF